MSPEATKHRLQVKRPRKKGKRPTRQKYDLDDGSPIDMEENDRLNGIYGPKPHEMVSKTFPYRK